MPALAAADAVVVEVVEVEAVDGEAPMGQVQSRNRAY